MNEIETYGNRETKAHERHLGVGGGSEQRVSRSKRAKILMDFRRARDSNRERDTNSYTHTQKHRWEQSEEKETGIWVRKDRHRAKAIKWSPPAGKDLSVQHF